MARTNRDPLRKIIGATQEGGYDAWYDVLECGHTVLEYVGIYGRENRSKRRCHDCAKLANGSRQSPTVTKWIRLTDES